MHSCPTCHRRFSPAAYVRYLLQRAIKASLRDDVPVPHLLALDDPDGAPQDRHARHKAASQTYRSTGETASI